MANETRLQKQAFLNSDTLVYAIGTSEVSSGFGNSCYDG